MKRKRLIIFTFLISFVFIAFSQKNNEKPEWAKQAYSQSLKNSYLEVIVVTTEVTTDAMRQKAKEMLVERRRLATGERVIFSEGETKTQSGLTVYAKPECEYIDYKNEVGYFLFQVLRKTNLEYHQLECNTDKYNFSARAFVPGMAQIYKGSVGKGVGFIVGEVVFIGGIVACESLRATYQSKINTTHNTHDRKTYIDNANLMQNLSYGCIAGACALYVWNVIDGAVAKGKKHVRVMPYASRNSQGVFLNYNF